MLFASPGTLPERLDVAPLLHLNTLSNINVVTFPNAGDVSAASREVQHTCDGTYVDRILDSVGRFGPTQLLVWLRRPRFAFNRDTKFGADVPRVCMPLGEPLVLPEC